MLKDLAIRRTPENDRFTANLTVLQLATRKIARRQTEIPNITKHRGRWRRSGQHVDLFEGQMTRNDRYRDGKLTRHLAADG